MSRTVKGLALASTAGVIVDNQNAPGAWLFSIRSHKADLETEAVGSRKALQGVYCRALLAGLEPGNRRLGRPHAGGDLGLS